MRSLRNCASNLRVRDTRICFIVGGKTENLHLCLMRCGRVGNVGEMMPHFNRRERVNIISETGEPGSGMPRHGCGSISLVAHARRIVRIVFFYIFLTYLNFCISNI